MPKISKRGEELPESAIRKLMPWANKAKSEGKHVYHVNIGQPDIKTPDHAIERIKNFNFELIPYGPSEGNDSYRHKVAAYYAKHGIQLDHTDILITTGGSEAIMFTCMACFNAGDELLIPEPFYANYQSFARASDVVVKTIMTTIEEGFRLPSIASFEKHITPKTKGILICNPNNPTGYLYSKEELEQLSYLAKKHDLYLISDEVYSEFVYDGEKHFSVMQLEGVDDHVIMIDSVSKRFSSCGIRIGSLVSRNKELIQTILKFGMARLCPPVLGQEVAEAAFDSPSQYMEDVFQEYLDRRNFFIKALNEIPGVYSPMPKGAFYSMVKLPVEDTDAFCKWLLSDFSDGNETVMLAPASGFYLTEGEGRDQVRVGYVLNNKDLARVVEILRKALAVYPYTNSAIKEQLVKDYS